MEDKTVEERTLEALESIRNNVQIITVILSVATGSIITYLLAFA